MEARVGTKEIEIIQIHQQVRHKSRRHQLYMICTISCIHHCIFNFSVISPTSVDDRIKCYWCAGSTQYECAKQDIDSTNWQVTTCPLGVRYCVITASNSHTRFERGCDNTLYDADNKDDADYGLGNCTNADYCTCKTDRCNSGFQGMFETMLLLHDLTISYG